MGEQFQLLHDLRKKYARPANVGQHYRLGDDMGSWLGTVRAALPSEQWPMGKHGPMEGIAQINVRELKHVPSDLSDLALITVFLDWSDDGLELSPTQPYATNGDGWCVRTYSSLESLARTQSPTASRVGHTAIRWELLEADYPTHDYVDSKDKESLDRLGLSWYDHHFTCASGFKVGGWPHTVQSEICWAPWNRHTSDPQCQFQVDSDLDLKGLHFIDGGACYFGRGTRGHADEWAFECQFF